MIQNQAIGGPLQAVADYMAAKANSDAKKMYDEIVDAMFHSFTNNPPVCNLVGQKFWKKR